MGLPSPKLSSVLIAVGFALSCFALTLFVWTSFGGPVPLEPEGYRFHALFRTDASQVGQGSDVRISGISVGRVTGTSTRGSKIEVEIEMKSEFAPIPSDTRAIVRYKTLLGESFIELSPGNSEARPLPEGETLPAAQVARAQQLIDVLGTFDEPTRDALKRFLGDLSTALRGRGDDVNAALGNAAPTVQGLEELLSGLDRQRSRLRALVRDGATALGALGRRQADVRSLVTAGEQVLSATAGRNRELTATVDALPPLLRELRATLGEAEGALEEAAPTLSTLRPVAPLVRPALEGTNELAPELKGLLRETPPVLARARRALPATTRLVEGAQPLMGALYPAGRELVPVVRFLTAFRRELVAGLANAASTTQASTPRDDGSLLHYIRLLVPITTEQIYGAPERLPSNRYNPYPRPGGLEDLASGLLSFNCDHTDNLQTLPVIGSAPPCREQPPWPFGGENRSFPHVERAAPDFKRR